MLYYNAGKRDSTEQQAATQDSKFMINVSGLPRDRDQL